MESHSKNAYVVIFIILVLSGVGYYFYAKTKTDTQVVQSPKYDIRKFSGNFVSLSGNIVTIKGTFSSDTSLPNSLRNPRVFTFAVGSTTVIEKNQTSWPKWETLRGTGTTTGRINLNDLPHTLASVSFDDFVENINSNVNPSNILVEVSFDKSIYEVTNPVAAKVFYKVLVMPK